MSESCPARLLLVGWATPRGAAHVVGRGYPGLYTPQDDTGRLSELITLAEAGL